MWIGRFRQGDDRIWNPFDFIEGNGKGVRYHDTTMLRNPSEQRHCSGGVEARV